MYLEDVGALTSRIPMGLQGLLQGQFYLYLLRVGLPSGPFPSGFLSLQKPCMHSCQHDNYGNLQELSNSANLSFPHDEVDCSHYTSIKEFLEDLKVCKHD
jgi:hypothetical protein